MDSSELIELFYNRTYEKFVNKQILDDKNYIVPRQQLTNYVRELVNIPFIDFLEYIKQNVIERRIEASDITQFDSFFAGEIEMCNALIWANNPGCQYIDIGRFFPNNTFGKSDGALRKYGEKHIKAATQLGLTFEYYNFWYLSCLGYIYPDLDEITRKRLLARTISRNYLYQQMLIDILKHDIDPVSYLGVLRRKVNNVCRFLNICLEECKKQGIRTYKIKGRTNDGRRPLDLFKTRFDVDDNDERSLYLEKYLIEIAKCPMCSIDEEIESFFRYRRGDKNACKRIIESNLRFVVRIAKQYRNHGLELQDLIQEGNKGLVKAVEYFDITRGVPFIKYAVWWIRQSITRALITIPYFVQIPLNTLILHRRAWDFVDSFEQINGYFPSVSDIEENVSSDIERLNCVYKLPADLNEMTCQIDDIDEYEISCPQIDDFSQIEFNKYLVNRLLQCLNYRNSQIIKSYYGIENNQEYETLERIGAAWGLTRERVRQVIEKSLKIMREYYVNHIDQWSSRPSDYHNEISYNEQKKETLLIEYDKAESIFYEFYDAGKRSIRNRIENNGIIKQSTPIRKKDAPILKSREKMYGYYTHRIMKLRQAGAHGKKILAKPALLVAVIDAIENNEIQQNKIAITRSLEDKYYSILSKYTEESQSSRLTRIEMPFWHLQSDKFWFLKPSYPNAKNFSPSKKWLIDNIKYARLDGDLWYLLQDEVWRNKLRNFIIEHKLIDDSVIQNENVQIEKTDTIMINETMGQPKFLISTPLNDLVRLGIITERQLKHCNKKGLRTIGDVKKKIEYHHLTPDSTRFTKYTLDMWFGIVGLLNNKI